MPDAAWMPFAAGAIIFVSCALQSTVGFGYSFIALPLLLAAGFDLPEAVCISIIPAALQKVLATSLLRRAGGNGRQLLLVSLFGLAGVPLGIWLMAGLAGLDRGLIRRLVGGLILVLVLVPLLLRLRPRARLNPAWGAAAGLGSGFFFGLANCGGPIMTIWTHAHEWPSEKLRFFPHAFSLVLAPVQIALLAWRFSPAFDRVLPPALMFLPVALLGVAAGQLVGKRLSAGRLRLAATVLLILIGLESLLR